MARLPTSDWHGMAEFEFDLLSLQEGLFGKIFSHDAQHIFLDLGTLIVREETPSMLSAKIALPAGRAPTYDWPTCYHHLDKLFEQNGDLSPDDFNWSRKSHVVKAMADFFAERGETPSDSTLKTRTGEYLRARRAAKGQ